MLAIALWFQKVKATLDAMWALLCLFCVPGVVVAAISVLVPPGERHGEYANPGGASGWSLARINIKDKAPSSYSPAPGTGGYFSYRLGLFDNVGRLIHEYPDQLIDSTNNAQHGSIVIEIPSDIPTGEYRLRVLKGNAQIVRDVPVTLGEVK